MSKSALVNILKTCLDPASALQLQREIDENPDITAQQFIAILERDFGKDYNIQAREEWAAVRLEIAGNSLSIKDWRTFQQKFEVAASRVEDKTEREEYDMLFKQLSSKWQEKIIKQENTNKENKDWVRIGCHSSISEEEVADFLDNVGVDNLRIERKSNGILKKNVKSTQWLKNY